AVGEYVELTAAGLDSPELVQALYEETEGNPLFVTETVRLLALEGLQRDEARISIPQSVRDVIARRLSHLSDECNRVLELASVLGREFAQAQLAGVSDVSEDELLETLDEAMTARLVSDVPGAPGRLRFAHVLIRDTLYDGLTTARRVRLHRFAVAALEALYRDEPGPHLAELAHHSVAASEFDKALGYARRAGDWTLALLAHEEAVRLYELALETIELARAHDERERTELLLSLGEAHARAGDRAASKATFMAAAELAKRLGEGLAALDQEDDDVVLRVRLLARLAGALRDEHSRERRDQLSREAVELARRSGSDAALVYALAGRASSIVAPDTTDETFALAQELCEVAGRTGDRERLVDGHLQQHVVHVRAGNL